MFALAILILYIAKRTLFLHNSILGLAILGIGTNLGIILKPITIVLLMSIFSIYDIIAVYSSKYMITLFKNFSHRGATLAFLYPKTFGKLNPNNLFILGTGDVAFPMLLVSALTRVSLNLAISAAIGSIVGAATIFYLLSIQKNKRPMPALPPIAFFTILGVIIQLMFPF
jgi:presenilin-like A22 family membrane protease